MKRRHRPEVGLFLLVAVLAAIAWLTRHPDAQIVRQAQEWPLIGSAARVFVRAYAPEQDAERESQRSESLFERRFEVVVVEPDLERIGAKPYCWVQPGSQIYPEPDADSAPLFVTTALANLPILQRSEDWIQVAQPRLGESPLVGWIRADAAVEPTPAKIPDPVLPLAAIPIDPLRLDRAKARMAVPIDVLECGPYPVVTDAPELDWLAGCSSLAVELEEIFASRYGLRPVSLAAETILVFDSGERYRAFRDEERVPFESHVAHAFPSRGYIAILQGERSSEDLVSSLLHELTHLVTRRSLGPALPAWLSEGLADDVGQSAIDGFYRISPGEVGGETWQLGAQTLRSGGIASLVQLQTVDQLQALPRLSEVVRLDEEEFYDAEKVQLHYALSSFWIRYLLSEPDGVLARGFRSYLQAIAAGTPMAPSLLSDSLGTDLDELESGFRDWIRGLEITEAKDLRALEEVSPVPETRPPAR
ncbi:MAG: hypothetical protein P8Y44_00095 [Acidobacteriota bacterium]